MFYKIARGSYIIGRVERYLLLIKLITFPGPIISYSVNEKYIGSAVNKILWYRLTKNLTFLWGYKGIKKTLAAP